MKILVLAALMVLLAAAAAEASTPTSYRVEVNWLCRSYTPAGKRLEAQMKKAQAADDYVTWSIALGRLLRVDLEQDTRIEAVPVPGALAAEMTPILERTRTIDRHIRAAVADLRAGRSQAMLGELLATGNLAKPLDARLGAAGLWDCGAKSSEPD